jgi:hypothetical protein
MPEGGMMGDYALRPYGPSPVARMSWPVPHRRELLARLYLSRAPFRVIAQEYGGTPHGVRSTVRKMIERGELMQREQRRDPNTGQFA